MSVETQIADFNAQAAVNIGLPQQIAAQATANNAALLATMQGRIAAMSTEFWVDQTLGLDTNAGTAAAPLKTIQKAIDLTPPGGVLKARLARDCLVTADIMVDNRRVNILSANATRYRLMFDRSFYETGGVQYRRPFKFIIKNSPHLNFESITVAVPAADGIYAAMNGSTYHSSIVGASWFNDTGLPRISFAYCDIEIPAAAFGNMCGIGGDGQLLVWQENSCTFTVTAGNGKRIVGITNTAGTAVSGLNWCVSNLTNI